MKTYILVRQDISPGYQLAQSIHAAVEHSRANPGEYAPTVVVLSVRDEEHLLDYGDLLWKQGALFTVFHEPDINEHTALCTVSDGAMFACLPLAGGAMAST